MEIIRGYFFVKQKGRWIVAKWTGTSWLLNGDSKEYSFNYFTEIYPTPIKRDKQ